MNAKVETLRHYVDVESTAREIAKARETIDQLRGALHDCLAEIQDIATAYGRENIEWTALIQRTNVTLLNTLPGADLDAMSKPERAETLRDTLMDIAHAAAAFEARHMGEFNWSGKELYRKESK